MFQRCGCADTRCSPPRGRCCVCGSPCWAVTPSASEVCVVCIPRIDQVLQTEALRPGGAGWELSEPSGDGSAEILAVDGFDSDEEAAAHVVGLVVDDVVEGSRS